MKRILLSLAVLSLGWVGAKGGVFVAVPYLQNFTPSSVTVMFQTKVPVHTFVEYGTDTLHLHRARTLLAGQEPCFDIENKIILDSLKTGVKYYYRVKACEVKVNQSYHKEFGVMESTGWHTFTLPAASLTDFTAVVLNDLHENDKLMTQLMNVVKEHAPDYDMLFYNGDCLPEPPSRDYAVKRINTLMTSADAADRMVTVIRGNHEIRNAYSAGMLSLTDNFGGRTYGAFSFGDTRFVVLDCGEDKDDSKWVYYGLNDFAGLRLEQRNFLSREIKSKAFRKASRHILIQHIPIWGDDNAFTDKFHPWTALWAPYLEKGKFDIDITAHAHFFYWLDRGMKGNPMPCVGGGGPAFTGQEAGTAVILKKRGKQLTLTVYNAKGEQLLDKEL